MNGGILMGFCGYVDNKIIADDKTIFNMAKKLTQIHVDSHLQTLSLVFW